MALTAQTLFIPPRTPLQPLDHPLFAQKQVRVWIKRDDLNHPMVQGNKWHKLRPVIQSLQPLASPAMLTFGGAHSNHLAATAALGQALGIPTIGLIRGEELAQAPDRWSPTLKTAQQQGMQLHFLSRSDYRCKQRASAVQALINHYGVRYPDLTLVPEGGTSALALAGLKAPITQLQSQQPDWTHLYTAVGTGGTLAGLTHHAAAFATPHTPKRLIGVSTLKSGQALSSAIQTLSGQPQQASVLAPVSWRLHHGAEFRGYGRPHPELKNCQAWFESQFGILLDPIYTSRMITAFMQDLNADLLKPGARIILYHSGGLQGRPDQTTV